ncbi:MAG: MmgE/PrpD family protein [Firmicutes bacterium]|jgi:2-methylcitrate dehydratase PrpD|nr:MmgE/PrpD family protein [Bacillota bacterium]
MDGGKTAELCEYLVRSDLCSVPGEVILKAKWCALDSLANSIAGGFLRPSRIIEDLVRRWAGAGEATILSAGFRAPLPHAVYANSYNANALDFDDTHDAQGHPGAMIIPAAFSVSEFMSRSGEQFLSAVIHAYEVSLRIARSLKATPERYKRVMGQASYLVFGTASVASKLLGLDEQGTINAFGIAGASAPVPFVRKFGLSPEDRPVAWVKNNFGWASMAGVTAALLAAEGFVGNKSILDGECGFWVMAGSDRCDFAKMTEGLGSEYLLLDTAFKPYASCRWTHAALDAVERIISRSGGPGALSPSDVDSIRVVGFYESGRSLSSPEPENIIDAQFSLPYLLALSVAGKSPRHGLRESDLEDAAVRGLARRVSIEIDDEYSKMFFDDHLTPYTVTILMKDGRALTETVYSASGGRESPLGERDLQEKFMRLVAPVVGDRRAESMISSMLNLERVPDMRQLIRGWFAP